MAYILALDQGTTSSRAILFDHDGAIKGVAQREFRQIFPRAGLGRARSPGDLDVADRRGGRGPGRGVPPAARRGRHRDHQPARDDARVGPRRPGEPIHNAIVWQDRRTAEHCDRLRADGAEPLVRERTGLVLDAYFSGTKLAWILDNVPGARRAGRGGRAGLRHRGHLARLAAHERPPPRHRSEQRVADAALQHPHRRVGRRAAAPARRPARRAARGAQLQRGLRRTSPRPWA